MKAPSLDDRRVKVTAYLTDETFGYEHWRAAQFSPPDVPTTRPALLVIFHTAEARDGFEKTLQAFDDVMLKPRRPKQR
jgi:hypothetical protein